MSVQAGIWNFDGRPVDRKLLESLSESLSQQGPDGESWYMGGSVALLYRPFHTTAESRQEKQPYTSSRGSILTWDGRLDNREVLIAELRSDLDASPTDLAIFLAAFDRWDTDCFRRIVGDWAVSIWKPEQRELLFASDYMAIRHIFYYLKNDRIWWSTDLSPLVLLSEDKFHVDDDYVAGYFANDPDAHLTPYREIRAVPPGHFVRVRNETASVERYWLFSSKSRIRYKTDREYEEHFRQVFRQSVRRRLRSDSPMLAELSGGLDSSSIVCVADDIIATGGPQPPVLETLSFFNKCEPHGDDWIYFPKIEAKRGRIGKHIDTSCLGISAARLDYPQFEAFPGYLGSWRKLEEERAAIVRNGGYRVTLSGLGGDEFMGAIPEPCAQLGDLIVQFKLFALIRQLIAWSLVKRRPCIQLFSEACVNLLPTTFSQYLVRQAKTEPWIQRTFAKGHRIALRQLEGGKHFNLWLPTRRSLISVVQMFANKLANWTPSSLALEEIRYPYLDHNVIEFVLSIPAAQLLRPGQRRSLMRRSLAGIVPDEILSRSTKQFGSRTPIVELEHNWQQLRGALNRSISSRLGYINEGLFWENLEGAKGGKQIDIVRMQKTISLEFWLRDLAARRLLDGETPISVPLEAESLDVTRKLRQPSVVSNHSC